MDENPGIESFRQIGFKSACHPSAVMLDDHPRPPRKGQRDANKQPAELACLVAQRYIAVLAYFANIKQFSKSKGKESAAPIDGLAQAVQQTERDSGCGGGYRAKYVVAKVKRRPPALLWSNSAANFEFEAVKYGKSYKLFLCGRVVESAEIFKSDRIFA